MHCLQVGEDMPRSAGGALRRRDAILPGRDAAQQLEGIALDWKKAP